MKNDLKNEYSYPKMKKINSIFKNLHGTPIEDAYFYMNFQIAYRKGTDSLESTLLLNGTHVLKDHHCALLEDTFLNVLPKKLNPNKKEHRLYLNDCIPYAWYIFFERLKGFDYSELDIKTLSMVPFYYSNKGRKFDIQTGKDYNNNNSEKYRCIINSMRIGHELNMLKKSFEYEHFADFLYIK